MEVTIVIPTFNRYDALLETLDALTRLDYPPTQWEAIIVDDGSTDDTEAAVGQWLDQHQAPMRYLKQQNAGRSVARNRGAAEAQGRILIFIDNDIIVEPDFIKAHLDMINTNPGCWITGRIIQSPKLTHTPFGRYRQALFESYMAQYPAASAAETDGMSAANVALPTADFRRLGGFDENLSGPEDWDLAWRARQTGIRVLYDPRIAVLHNDWAISLDAYCRRERQSSAIMVLLYRKWGEASAWAALCRESAPIRWNADGPGLILKKSLKWALATPPGSWLVRGACSLAERLAPDTTFTRRAYEVAIAAAIFQGVRAGYKRYGPPATTNREC